MRDINNACDEFEDKWADFKSGELPPLVSNALAQFRSTAEDEISSVLASLCDELIQLDIEFRSIHGLDFCKDSYLALLPTDFHPVLARLEWDRNSGVSQSAVLPAENEIGQQIGPYRILSLIGQGGMGSVLLAQQIEPVRRHVAVKVIKSSSPSSEVLARFDAERQALAMMDHPNIARVLDAGITNSGQPYFAMEFVDGLPLTEFCDESKLAVHVRLQLFVQACRAVQHAHQKGIIHRDIKPSNLLATIGDQDPIVKAIDFGLAKAIREETVLTNRTLATQHGQVLGTLAYMSPEQANFPQDLDTRTDVYSLGVVLYELLTGTTPITCNELQSEPLDRILALIREQEAPSLSRRLGEAGTETGAIADCRRTDQKSLCATVRGDLDWIVRKSLEKDRSRRYDSAAALADDITRYLNHEPIEAHPPSKTYRLSKAFHKHRKEFVGAMSFVGLLLVSVAVSGTMWWRNGVLFREANAAAARADLSKDEAINKSNLAERLKTQAEKEKETAQAAEARALQKEEEAKDSAAAALAAQRETQRLLARSIFKRAVVEYDRHDLMAAETLLGEIPKDHRSIEWHLLKRFCRGSVMTCYGHVPGPFLSTTHRVSFSPDSKTVVSGGYDRQIRIWDASTGEDLASLRGHTERISSLDVSSDSKLVASASFDKSIRLWDIARKSEVARVDASERVLSVMFVNDYLISATYWSIYYWQISKSNGSLALRKLARANFDSGFRSMKLNAREDQVLVSTSEGLSSYSLPDLSCQSIDVFDTEDIGEFTLSPDDSTCVGIHAKAIHIVDRDQHESPIVVPSEASSVSFSPDGATFASGNNDGSIDILGRSSGEVLSTLSGHTKPVTSVSFSRDGSRLASASSDATIRFWNLTTSAEAATLQSDRNVVRVAYTPDKSLVALAIAKTSFSEDQIDRVELRKSGTNDVRKFDQIHGLVTGLSLSHDASLLAVGRHDKIELWQTRDGILSRTLHQGEQAIANFRFHPQDREIAAISLDGKLRIWDADTGRVIHSTAFEPRLTPHWPSAIEYTPTGNLIALSEDQVIHVLDRNGKRKRVLTGHSNSVTGLCFSQDGRKLASAGSDKQVVIWDLKETSIEQTISFDTTTFNVAFCANDKRIAVETLGGIEIASVIDGERVLKFPMQKALINHFGFGNQEIQFFISNSGRSASRQSIQFPFHGHGVVGAIFSPSGRYLSANNVRCATKIWDLKTQNSPLTFYGSVPLIVKS